MSITRPLAFATAALLGLAPFNADAQQQRQSSPQEQRPLQSPQPDGQSTLQPGQLRISDWFDLELQTADGAEIGELEDLIVQDNRITAAIVEIESATLGIGERKVAIPIDRIRRNGDRLVVDMTREELQALPALRGGN